jgi:hypothetical protein
LGSPAEQWAEPFGNHVVCALTGRSVIGPFFSAVTVYRQDQTLSENMGRRQVAFWTEIVCVDGASILFLC